MAKYIDTFTINDISNIVTNTDLERVCNKLNDVINAINTLSKEIDKDNNLSKNYKIKV